MGPILPKPVTTQILERRQNEKLRVGLASMNGFREKQEDAHAMLLNDKWGFFGVFDGHCGPLCSQYEAKRFMEVIKDQQMPLTEDYITDLCLRLDKEFLDRQEEGGSTGTFMMVYMEPSGKYRLQVGNVGDSRVVAGRSKQKECVSMTEDHKPSNDGERMRIERAGGHVSNNRVDGSLAVSRAFGDGNYKDGKSDRDHKVIAVPEFKNDLFEPGDIVLLCCDGVFESDVFSNESVIEFIYEKLETTSDLAKVASMVTQAALDRGSKDNISAMIVQLGGTFPPAGENEEIVPGPFVGPNAAIHNEKFRTAYSSMCETAHMTLYEGCDLRYEYVRAESEKMKKDTKCQGEKCDLNTLCLDDLKKIHSKLQEQQQGQDADMDKAALVAALTKLGDEGKDVRPIDVQDWEVENKEMCGDAAPPGARGTPQRLEHWKQWWDRKSSEQGPENQGQDAVTTKILELQRAGLPLPIILGLLAQQRGGGAPGV